MNDTYCELIVKRITTTKEVIYRALMVMLTVIAITLTMMFIASFVLIIGFVFIYLTLMVFRKTDKEYEYQFVSGEMDIDIIYAKHKRKKAKRYDMHKIEVLAPLKSDKFAHYDNNLRLKTLDYSSGRADSLKYAFIMPAGDGVIEKIIFEPNEKILNAIKTIVPSKVFIA